MARVIDRSKPPQAPKKLDSSKKKAGKQLPLIDVGPENLKEIEPVAEAYYDLVHQRLAIQAKELEHREKIKELVHAAGLKRGKDGSIRFKCGDVTIELYSPEEKVKVTKEKVVEDEAV